MTWPCGSSQIEGGRKASSLRTRVVHRRRLTRSMPNGERSKEYSSWTWSICPNLSTLIFEVGRVSSCMEVYTPRRIHKNDVPGSSELTSQLLDPTLIIQYIFQNMPRLRVLDLGSLTIPTSARNFVALSYLSGSPGSGSPTFHLHFLPALKISRLRYSSTAPWELELDSVEESLGSST